MIYGVIYRLGLLSWIVGVVWVLSELLRLLFGRLAW